jgi:hypothetical protein
MMFETFIPNITFMLVYLTPIAEFEIPVGIGVGIILARLGV